MSEQKLTTTLYRVENPNIAARPDGVVSHEDLVGQWFSPNPDTAFNYLRKSTQTFGADAGPVEGARLVTAEVPTEQLDALHVSQHPVASGMDVENDNYIVPRDGTFPTAHIELDPIIGDLRGKLGNFNNLKEAKKRILLHLGGLAATEEKPPIIE